MTSSELEASLSHQMTAASIATPVSEYHFWPGRRYRFDFAWVDQMVACEVEGGTWSGGRHTRGAGFESDCVKYSNAAIMGWCVVRVTGNMVNDGRAIHLIRQALERP